MTDTTLTANPSPNNIQATLIKTALNATQLTRKVELKHLPASTKRLKNAPPFLGQDRAKNALDFSLSMPFADYHVCAIGTHGLGKRRAILQYLQHYVQQSSPAKHVYDWVYVHDFKQHHHAQILAFDAGYAATFQQHLQQCWLSYLHKPEQFPNVQHIQALFQTIYTSLAAHCSTAEQLKHYLDDVSLAIEQQQLHFAQASFRQIHATQLWQQLDSAFHIHIMVNHSQAIRPIVYEDFPSLQRLFGYIAHDAHAPQAANHLDLQAGTLLKANGGFLIVELEQILQQPQVWHILKHALQCRHWQWSSLQHLMPATRLQVSDIPLQLTVILLAEPETYDDLLLVDQDLARLFKIRADFTDTLPRQAEHELSFVQWIADYIQQDQLLPFDREALAEILTDASHRAEDQNALSLHGASLSELLRESHFHAMQAQSDGVKACHVQTALKQRLYRLGYWRELYWQDLSQGTQLIETQGQRLGQVNALSVIQYADSEFGFPSRLTASVCQGAGDILDIERSVELGGSLHAKGTLLMSSFLKSHFGRQQILNFSAALAFEQSYGEVDGDSATVAELSALISAISQIPIHQSWAITGSMNQLGQVQPVGGINAKIEGFFDACQLQGLTGSQGVIIPRQNIQHLMLRQDIIDAVQQGKFHVHAIDHVEQALEILMNRPVGEFNAQGQYSPHSIYAAVMQQLAQWQESETELLLEEKPKAKKKKAKKKAKHKQDDELSAQEQT